MCYTNYFLTSCAANNVVHTHGPVMEGALYSSTKSDDSWKMKLASSIAI